MGWGNRFASPYSRSILSSLIVTDTVRAAHIFPTRPQRMTNSHMEVDTGIHLEPTWPYFQASRVVLNEHCSRFL